MGTWGVGIYSNDTAMEVKDLCEEIFPFVTVDQGNDIILHEFEELISMEMDSDVASFWFALADWQWKHGILKEEICQNVLKILSGDLGLFLWKGQENSNDIKKRNIVLTKLKEQLKMPMPAPKALRKKLRKPKHKPGDIILLNISDEAEGEWSNTTVHEPFEYASSIIRQSSVRIENAIDAKGKYLAVLCVGKIKQLHSTYVAGVYDEDGVYVFYDYCEAIRPTIEKLRCCGFLPCITHEYNNNSGKIENIGWTYKFTTFDTFRNNGSKGIRYSKIYSAQEVERFITLLDNRYSNKIEWCLDLRRAFLEFFEEKTRLDNVGIEIDTLIDSCVENPLLLKETL